MSEDKYAWAEDTLVRCDPATRMVPDMARKYAADLLEAADEAEDNYRDNYRRAIEAQEVSEK